MTICSMTWSYARWRAARHLAGSSGRSCSWCPSADATDQRSQYRHTNSTTVRSFIISMMWHHLAPGCAVDTHAPPESARLSARAPALEGQVVLGGDDALDERCPIAHTEASSPSWRRHIWSARVLVDAPHHPVRLAPFTLMEASPGPRPGVRPRKASLAGDGVLVLWAAASAVQITGRTRAQSAGGAIRVIVSGGFAGPGDFRRRAAQPQSL
jgi:hypothetical protein